MRKLICILLIAALAFVCTACVKPVSSANPQNAPRQDDPNPEEVTNINISGIWQTELNLSDFLNLALSDYEALSMGILVTDYMVTVTMEFDEDGNYRVKLDKDSVDASFTALMGEVEYLIWQDLEMIYMDPESEMTLEEALKKEGVDPNKDLEEIRTHLYTEGYIGQLLEKVDREGKYLLVENELYLSKDGEEEVQTNFLDIVAIRDGQLIFEECLQDMDFEGGILYPVYFNKIG